MQLAKIKQCKRCACYKLYDLFNPNYNVCNDCHTGNYIDSKRIEREHNPKWNKIVTNK